MMGPALRYLVLAPLIVAATLYGTAATALYAYQRDIIYQPPPSAVGAPPQGSIYRTLLVETAEGGKLTIWTAPAASESAPTVIFFHGNASHVADFAETGARFHAQGWGIVLAAYRGYSGDPGEPSEAGLIEDAHAILDAVAPRGPVILWGHSLGSGIAARLASEGRAQALILESPFTSLADMGAMLYPIFPVHWLITDRFDTASLVPDIQMPVLIFHGSDDQVVPFALGQGLAESFGARATFVALDNVGHIPHRRDLTAIVVEWFGRAEVAKTMPR